MNRKLINFNNAKSSNDLLDEMYYPNVFTDSHQGLTPAKWTHGINGAIKIRHDSGVHHGNALMKTVSF